MKSRLITLLAVSFLVSTGFVAAQQQYGTITGTVEDEQGGVLPGVTVTLTSDAIIGGSRASVTGAGGTYTFRTLPPGDYNIRFELSGFNGLTREGIEVRVATVMTVNVQLRVGGVQETITVTGESPVVDLRQNITQTNIDEDLYESVPTARNPWVMAGLVPGMITGQMDVGGNRGMQQYSLEINGSANSQKSFSIDGLKVNWPGGSGGWTMQYYDFGMFEEYNFQTSAMSAESDVAGVFMNMVTRSGSNNLSGTQAAHFSNDSLQGSNVDAELARAFGIEEGGDTSASGNPIDGNTYDLQGTLGGPLVADKLWFFGSGRWWRLDQFLPGTDGLGDNGGPVIDDNRITNAMGKVTWQADENTNVFFMANKNWKYRYHRNRTGEAFAETAATSFQKQPAQNAVISMNRLIGASSLLDLRFGRMWGETPYFFQDSVTPDTIALRDGTLGQALRAAPDEFFNPNHRNQINANLTYYLDQGNSGRHDIKVGIQIGRERYQVQRFRNQDMVLRANDGVANEVTLYNSPNFTDNRLNTWATYIQDSWTIGTRTTLNLGVRFDGINGRVPPQSSPAGNFVGARSFGEIPNVPDWPINAAPRLGFSYDLRGDGRTALKAYYGRTYIQTGSQFTEGVNPVAEASVNVAWNDFDGDLFLAPGPSGGFADSPELDLTRFLAQGFAGGLTTTYDPDTQRPYSDLFDVGIEHQLATDLSMGVRYIRRHHRRGIARLDRARPTSAYSPITVNYDDPIDGPGTLTAYDLDPAFLVTPDRVITNLDALESNYNGVTIDMRKRMSNNWQMLGGVTFGSHKGFDQSDGYYTTVDFNDPNALINRDDGSVFTDLPWTLTLSGSYILPKGVVFAAKYTGRAGQPRNRTFRVTGLTQGASTIRVVQRGVDRADSFTKFVDFSLSKSFSVGESARIEPTLQVFNLLNDNAIDIYNEAIGGSFQRPSRILAPRIVRFAIKWSF